MSFFKSVLSTVSSLAAKANLDNLIEEDDRKAAEAAATAKTEAGKGKTASLPPLGPEYAHLNFTYITENIIAMGFPSSVEPPTRIRSRNDVAVIASLLKERHAGYFMIWNLSEESYDSTAFDNQVLEFPFPGYPSPPLGLMFKLCTSVESWLNADPKNVAAIHCMTGKGRTSVVVAAVLAWMGYADTPMHALSLVSEARNSTLERMANPSQRRYVQYFTNMMDGMKPKTEPLLLSKVVLNGIPNFTSASTDAPQSPIESSGSGGCRPHLQIFKAGELLYSSTWSSGKTFATEEEEAERCRLYSVSDSTVRFTVDTVLQGDILIRCRHLGNRGQRTTVLRAAFHTGYIRQQVLRFPLAQLDVACDNGRFPPDAVLELHFSPVERGQLSAGTAVDPEMAEDSMFWEQVEKRKADRAIRRDAASARSGIDPRQMMARAKSAKASGSKATGPEFGISGDGSDDEGVAASAAGDKPPAFDLVDSDDEIELNLTTSAEKHRPAASTSSGSAPVAAVPSAYSADADELDALERELGLDIGMSSALKAEPAAQPSIVVVTPATVTASVPKSDSTAEFVVVDAPPAAGPPAPAPSASTADADIDELESFIDNL